MTEDNFHYELMHEAKRLASQYMSEMIQDDGEAASAFVREFVTLMAPIMEEETLRDPVKIALNSLTYVEVFKLCFLKGYSHADKKVRAINSLKNAFDS
jgi:hypothetical protein